MSNNIIQGLHIISELEKDCLFMSKGISELDREIGRLGHERKISPPIKEKVGVGYFLQNVFLCLCGGAILGGIVGVIYGAFFYEIEWWLWILGVLACTIVDAFYGMLIGAGIGIVAALILTISKNEKYNSEYISSVERYEKSLEDDKLRVKKELKKKSILKAQRKNLVSLYEEAKSQLRFGYSRMRIDDTYKGIIIVSYMYEFARLGISDRFDGPNGLYKLIRDELNIKQIQSTLEDISYKLDEIIDNQSKIYSEIQQVNINCSHILSNTIKEAEIAAKNNVLLEKAVENTSLTAYYADQALTYQSYYNFMRSYR